MENTIENAKQFVYDNSNFNSDLGMGYIMAKMCVDYANKLNKPCVMPLLFDKTQLPRVSVDDTLYSEDVFIIDENGLNGLAYYCFEDNKWYFHTDTLVDYDEENHETEWKWYYPPVKVEDVFNKA